MVASTVEIVSLPDGVSYPNTEDSPAITVRWTGGTGPFDVEYTWDDDPTFANGNGNRQTSTNTSVTSPDTEAPPAALADTSDGTTWYIRANVVDTGDSNNALADSHQFTYFAPNPAQRTWLHLLANVGVAFEPTDDPGDWGVAEGGTQGADGDVIEFRRYQYLLGNVGVGFVPTDTPVDGWGPGGTEGPDGETLDFDRFLYLLANVDTTQPCPFLFRLSSQIVSQGSSLTIFGQGLVSASSPTADAWDAEVRLYDTPDLGGSFQVLAISSYVAGATQDSITVTIPSNATSGFVAVVHTTGATCAGSNFLGVTVLAVEPDAKAGWWVEIWNIRNSQRIISALPDVAEATLEHIPGDIGNGSMLLPQNHPDIPDILDRANNIQRIVKVYQHNRFSYSFIPDDIEEAYTEDGARLARIYGEGQERMLKWGRTLFKDHPALPTRTRSRLYGSNDNLVAWLNGEESNLIQNGGFEDANTEGWSTGGGATLEAFTTVQHSGSYAGRVSLSALDGFVETAFNVTEGERCFADIVITDRGAVHDKTFEVELLDSEDNVVDSDTISPATAAWQPVTVSGIATVSGAHRLRVTQTAGTVEDYWWVDDAAAYAKISGTYQLSGNTLLRLSRTNVLGGLHSLEAVFDDDTGGITLFASVQPNQDYTFTLNFTGVTGEDVRASMRLGGLVDESQITATGGNDTITLAGTAGAEDLTVRIFISGEEVTGTTIYIDNSSLIPGAAAANGGEITLDALEANQARGTLDFVTVSYSRTHDSSGVPWPEDHPWETLPEWTLWDLYDKLQGLGYRMLFAPADWRGGGDTGWEISLFAPGNSVIDHSTTVDGPAILPGQTIEAVRPSSAAPLETVVYGEGAAGIWSVAELDAATLTALERREGFISNPAAQSATTVFRAASHRLATTANRGDSFVATFTEHGDPLPYFDFLPEDALRAHLPGNEGRDHVPDDTYRAAAVTSRLTGSGRVMSWQVDFGNYALYQARIQNLILSRMLEREASENYRPGSGSVSSRTPGGGGGTTTGIAGLVPSHEHVQSDIVPPIPGPAEIPDVWADLDDVAVSGAVEGDMAYRNAAGLWIVVGGTKGDGKVPAGQADGSVAWATPAGGGGGGGSGIQILGRADPSAGPGGAEDDEFDDDTITGWTDVFQSGEQRGTFVEKYSRMQYRHTATGTGTRDLHALLKAPSGGVSVGDYIEAGVAVRSNVNFHGLGVIMADGATWGSGSQIVFASRSAIATTPSAQFIMNGWSNFNSAIGNSTAYTQVPMYGIHFIRLKYEAANTWGIYYSADGFDWRAIQTNFAFTLTPTHVGIVVNFWDIDTEAVPNAWMHWHYFRMNPADE